MASRSGLTLAIPALSADLHPSSTELLWIVDVYGFLVRVPITMTAVRVRACRQRGWAIVPSTA
jgi:MFS transporter, DHA2 family, multidrug resistance protein